MRPGEKRTPPSELGNTARRTLANGVFCSVHLWIHHYSVFTPYMAGSCCIICVSMYLLFTCHLTSRKVRTNIGAVTHGCCVTHKVQGFTICIPGQAA